MEGETLFWSKAAALLGLPQPEMIDSKLLPMSRKDASVALARLIADNLDEPGPPPVTREQVFETWARLAAQYQPVFLEKSPHHLHNHAVLELLLDAEAKLDDVQFRFIGLVRNPLDTLYSMWRRWRTIPEKRSAEWSRVYTNLQWLQQTAPDRTMVVRYEDLVSDPAVIEDLLGFIGVAPEPGVGQGFHRGSLGSWQADSRFGYQPSDDLRAVAAIYGYGPGELDNPPNRWWPVDRELRAGSRAIRTRAGTVWRGLTRRSIGS